MRLTLQQFHKVTSQYRPIADAGMRVFLLLLGTRRYRLREDASRLSFSFSCSTLNSIFKCRNLSTCLWIYNSSSWSFIYLVLS